LSTYITPLPFSQSVSVSQPPHLVVTSAAVYKAINHINEVKDEIKASLAKGQTSLSGINNMNNFPIEIAYEDVKYIFTVSRTSPDTIRLSINDQQIDVKVRQTPEGALVANFGGAPHRILGLDEPLGLRLSVDGVTTLMPTIFDPSELRTDVTGKVVRYLQEPGKEVKAGEPYVEVEAMKMIMPIKATESGTVSHTMSPGSIISAGDLLATLKLKDPSKVKKIVTHSGKLDIDDVLLDISSSEGVAFALAGYSQDVESVAVSAMEGFKDIESAAEFVSTTVNSYLETESKFDSKLLDDVVLGLIKDNKDSLDAVIETSMAHQQLGMRNKLILAILRQVETFPDRFEMTAIPSQMLDALTSLTKLQSKQYGEIVLSSSSIIRESEIPSFAIRKDELRSALMSEDKSNLARSTTLSAGVDLLSALFDDSDEKIRAAALEVYVRRVYRAHSILSIDVATVDGRLTANWKFQFADTPAEESPIRNGHISVVANEAAAISNLDSMLSNMESNIGAESGDEIVNVFHVALTDKSADSDDTISSKWSETLTSKAAVLHKLQVRSANVLIAATPKNPRYFSFPHCDGFKEDTLRRNMRPTFHHLLELARLTSNHALVRMNAVGKNAQVYLGTEQTTRPIRGPPPQVLFVRALSHSVDVASSEGARRALLQGLDELERAQSDSRVSETSSSRIFLHSLPELDTTPEEIVENFKEIMDKLKSTFATRLLKLRVDEIEVKLRVRVKENGKDVIKPVRLIASSMSGEWLKVSAYNEFPDKITGVTQEFCR
jgi:acetyl-CoA carboxylase / biotin carboxylase 1